jgi:hypothetical protein
MGASPSLTKGKSSFNRPGARRKGTIPETATMKTSSPNLLACLLALALPLASAHADTQRYRYNIDMKSGEDSYAGELSTTGFPTGPWYEVERDDKGRIVRAAYFRGDGKQSETTYHYTGDSALYDSTDSYKSGEHTGKATYTRDDKGGIVQIDQFTAEGSATTHEARTYSGNTVDEAITAADGTPKDHYVLTFADSGALSSYRRVIGTTFYEYAMDPTTGQSKSRRKVEGDKQVLSTTITYDENGDRLREDFFDPTGKPYAVFSYSDGLLVRKSYTFDDGTKSQADITYGDKHWSTQCRLTVNGNFICTFTYDRLPDGTVKRTLALGPNGDLWAEYPNQLVNDIGKDGQPVDRTDGIIHHAGNWW